MRRTRSKHPKRPTTSTQRHVIYRVQDRDGRGPWKPGFSDTWVEDRPDAEFEALKPWPVEFGDIMATRWSGGHVGCGCRSLEQLRRWITESEYATLRKHGYRAVRIVANRILAESKIQTVFERDKPLAKGAKRIQLY